MANNTLWKLYENDKVMGITEKNLSILKKYSSKVELDTVAAIYARKHILHKNKGKKEKAEHYKQQALEFVKKALPETEKRVKLILEGKTPDKVEKITKENN